MKKVSVKTVTTRIRLVEAQDAASFATQLARDAEETRSWQPARDAAFYTEEFQQERIRQLLEDHQEGTLWPGVILEDDQVIGQITVHTIVRGPVCTGSVGYWVSSLHWDKGHAGHALAEVLRIMRDDLGLHTAQASTQSDNARSHKVLERNGFSQFGFAHEHIFLDGTWRDCLMWERIL